MVFQKLTDEQKQKLFDLGGTHDRTAISSMRALIMRGSSVDEAQKIVRERRQAKYDYMEQVESEKRKRDEVEAVATAKPKAKTRVKKAEKVQAKETESPEAEEVKPKRTRAKKSIPTIEEQSPETESA